MQPRTRRRPGGLEIRGAVSAAGAQTAMLRICKAAACRRIKFDAVVYGLKFLQALR